MTNSSLIKLIVLSFIILTAKFGLTRKCSHGHWIEHNHSLIQGRRSSSCSLPKDTVRDLFLGIRLSLDHGLEHLQPIIGHCPTWQVSGPFSWCDVMEKSFPGLKKTMGNPKWCHMFRALQRYNLQIHLTLGKSTRKIRFINSFDIGECGTRCDPIWSKVLFVSIMNTAFILHGDPTPANVNFLSSLSVVNHLRGYLLIRHFIAMA